MNTEGNLNLTIEQQQVRILELEKQLENMMKGPTEYGKQIERELEPEYRRSQRIIKENMQDFEGREAEEIKRRRNSLSGYLSHLSRLVNLIREVGLCVEAEKIADYLNKLKFAWELYRNEYSEYIEENLSESELYRVKEQHEQAKDNYHKCAFAACERLRHIQQFQDDGFLSSRRQRDEEIISQYSFAQGSTKSKNRSLSSSKKRELQRNAELKKMVAEQAEEVAKLEAEMEKRKIDIELEKQKSVRKLRFEAEIAQKEADLMSENEELDQDIPRGPYIYTSTPLTKEEQTMSWVLNEAASSHELDGLEEGTRQEPHSEKHRPCFPFKEYDEYLEGVRSPKRYDMCPEILVKNHAQNAKTDEKPHPLRRSRTQEYTLNETSTHNAIMLKLNMLQAMQPVKFSGDADDFPSLRNRLRDNLEDGLLTDGQKMEFLPKFVCGEAYEVVLRASGCKYDDIVKLLEDRYGHPSAVAAACIEKLTVGSKIAHDDNKGLRNFAEQLESASKKLEGEYEVEASTTSNLKLIVSRLPNYLSARWGDTLYSIREKGRSPKLNDLAAFVKKQAALKNDPAFVTPTSSRNSETKSNTARPTRFTQRVTKAHPPLKTATFTTDARPREAYHADRKTENASTPGRCVCCTGNHDLLHCTQFTGKDLDGRWTVVKNNKLCHVCLKAGHLKAQCRSNENCGCGSERRHHKLLHNPPRPKAAPVDKKSEEKEDERTTQRKDPPSNDQKPVPVQRKTDQYATNVGYTEKSILLHVVPVKISAPEGSAITTYGLLDNGSRATVVDADVAEMIGLKGRKERISVNTLLNKEEGEFQVAEFQIQSADGEGQPIMVEEGLISQKFNISEEILPFNINRDVCPHLADIEVPEVQIPRVSVLIGKDIDEAHEILEVRKSNVPTCKLQAQRGPLGWVFTGTIERKTARRELNLNFTDIESLKLRDQIERFWKIDDYGTRQSVKEQEVLSREDMRAIAKLEETTVFKEGHYETGLLWRKDDVKLPNNREQAEKRLMSLKKRFQKDREFEDVYRDTMNSYIEKGYARKLSAEEASQTGPRTWFLPHFGVTNVNKPGKVRIVFDAAAEHEGTSLNKNLLQGPDCTNSLLGVLLRFREDRVALVADIEGMFHQVGVCEEDQDSLRFLWWSGDANEPPEEYVMTVHIFGARDSPCVANATLKKTADDNHDAFDPSTVSTVKNNFYVDDVLKSLPDAETATRMADQLTQLCMKGGFKLTKFMSNDREVLAKIPEEKRAKFFLDLKLQELPTERALGVRWDVESDTFGFKVSALQKPCTMRGVLSTISAVFDPLNFAAPVILPAKRIMQELWKKKHKWDQPLEGEILQQWSTWKENLPLLEQARVPRCYFTRTSEQRISLELHHFCDASEIGYGAVSYLRTEYQDGRIECSFVMAKSRNTPIKALAIPRLELQSAVLATRLDKAVRKELELDVQRVTFWTDSMIVLNYIRNETRRFQTYVANRVTEIREQTTPDQWRHCPGKDNPADDASRGLDTPEYLKNQRWLKGPEFLWNAKENWPENKFEEVSVQDLEVKREVYLTAPERRSSVGELTRRYSNWTVLLRRVAWLVKFTEWIKSRHVKEKFLTTEDLENAKSKVARIVQREAFPEEIKNLKKRKPVQGHSPTASLSPQLYDDGLLRVGGRLAKAPITHDAMHPIILPRKSHVTTILIRYLHEKNGHCGQEQVLALLREQFWVIQARVAIKRILGRCIECKKRRPQTTSQEMGELPRVRLTPYEPPFTYTGVDYFGPFHVKRGRGRVTEKRWGAIFVCMNSRAVHLEVAKSLETDDFIMVLILEQKRPCQGN